jgi:hypothetical protein
MQSPLAAQGPPHGRDDAAESLEDFMTCIDVSALVAAFAKLIEAIAKLIGVVRRPL